MPDDPRGQIEPVPPDDREASGTGLDGLARLAFLADAGELLATSPNEWVGLERLARLAVPTLADWCAIDVVDEAGGIRRAAIVHPDQTKLEWVRDLERRYPPSSDAAHGAMRVIATGKASSSRSSPTRI